MSIGIQDPTVKLFLEFIIYGVRRWIAGGPKLLDSKVAILALMICLRPGSLRIRNDVSDILGSHVPTKSQGVSDFGGVEKSTLLTNTQMNAITTAVFKRYSTNLAVYALCPCLTESTALPLSYLTVALLFGADAGVFNPFENSQVQLSFQTK